MPELKISDEEVLSAIVKLLLNRWKIVLFIFVLFAALFFGGGWYVFQDAKLRTHELMISLYEEVNEAKEKANELLDETEFASEEAQKRIDLIVQKLDRAQQVLDENVDILNQTIERTVEQQHQMQQQQVTPPERIEKPRLKKY